MASVLLKSFTRLRPVAVKLFTPLHCFSSTYRAAVLKKQTDELVIAEERRAQLKENQVRIKVHFCSLNINDYNSIKSHCLAQHFIPGCELSGEVLEVGIDVARENAQVGDRVVGLSLRKFGGLAEECILNQNDVWRLPSKVSRKDAAVLTYGHSTAIYVFSRLLTLSNGQTVVISSGPAGLGLAAVDVASNIYRAKVIAVCMTENIASLTRERGAHSAFKFDQKKIQDDIKKITSGTGASIIYDAIGNHVKDHLAKCLCENGKLVSVAPVEVPPEEFPGAAVKVTNLQNLRTTDLDLYRSLVSDTLDMADEGMITAYISKEFKLENVNEAIKLVAENRCNGKVLVQVKK